MLRGESAKPSNAVMPWQAFTQLLFERLPFCRAVEGFPGHLEWPGALVCCFCPVEGSRSEVAEIGEFGLGKSDASSSFYPTKFPDQRVGTSEHHVPVFNVSM